MFNLGMDLMIEPEAYLVRHDGLFDDSGKLTDPNPAVFDRLCR